MTRICRSTDTADGHECQQKIRVGADHCESGHYTAPGRDQTPHRLFNPSPTAASIGEVEDLLYPERDEKTKDDKLEVDLPPWRLRTVAQSTIGAIALSGAPAVTGVTNVPVLAGLALVGFVGPLINGIAQHKDDRRTAKADARDAQ